MLTDISFQSIREKLREILQIFYIAKVSAPKVYQFGRFQY